MAPTAAPTGMGGLVGWLVGLVSLVRFWRTEKRRRGRGRERERAREEHLWNRRRRRKKKGKEEDEEGRKKTVHG